MAGEKLIGMAEVIFADWLRGVHYPKLDWVIHELKQLGIPHRVSGSAIRGGSVLQIEKGRETMAMDILNRVIGELHVGVDNRTITIADLPDDHQLFRVEPYTSNGPLTHQFPTSEELNRVVDSTLFSVDPKTGADLSLTDKINKLPSPANVPVITVIPKTPTDLPKKQMERKFGKQAVGPVVVTIPKKVDPEPTPVVEDDDWDDEDWGDPEPETVTQQADRLLEYSDQLVMWDTVRQYNCRVYEVNSSHMSRIGAMQMHPPTGTSYAVLVGFKGKDLPYRYYPVLVSQWEQLLAEAIKNHELGPNAASVGEAFWKILRGPAETGHLVCERYDDGGNWVKVNPVKK